MDIQEFSKNTARTHVLLDAGGKILLLQKKGGKHAGWFELPEVPHVTGRDIVNEIQEGVKNLLGVEVRKEDISFAHVQRRPHAKEGEAVHFYYRISAWSGELVKKDSEEYESFAWFSEKEIPEQTIAITKMALECLQKKDVYSEVAQESTKIIVTGAAGFIGANYVDYVLKNHPYDEVIALDALTYAGNLENLAQWQGNPRFRFEKADICDAERVDALVAECDAIVHFAAETHVDRSIKDVQPFVRTNVSGTATLLDAAVKYNKRFHHISTDEVFGTLSATDAPFSKSSPYDPKNPYSASKAASDHLVRSYVNTHGLFATITNCSNNYGPYHFPEKLIPLFIRNLLAGKNVPVYGDGGQIRDWIYVEDHCRGVDMALRKGEKGETYLLGGKDAEITNLELTKKLLALTGRDESAITYVTDRPGHDRRYAIDYSFAKEKLGWEPLVSLEEGLERTMEWFRAHEGWVERCISGDYKKYYEEHYKGEVTI